MRASYTIPFIFQKIQDSKKKMEIMTSTSYNDVRSIITFKRVKKVHKVEFIECESHSNYSVMKKITVRMD